MKGIIFNLAEAVVGSSYGEDTWDAMLDATGLDGAYTSLGSYPDEDLTKLVTAASNLLGASPETVTRDVARGAIPLLAERYPDFFSGHASTLSFVLTLNDIIHAEVRKLYPGAVIPRFSFETTPDDGVVIEYRSPRRLCTLAEGFILGAADHYGEDVEIAQTECMHLGAERCLLHCRFGKRER